MLPTEPGFVEPGEVLYSPTADIRNRTNIAHYMRWLEKTWGLAFPDYDSLWHWSVENLEDFWRSIWDFYGIKSHRPYNRILSGSQMPGSRWFSGAELNYTEHALSRNDDHPAIVFKNESGPLISISYRELSEKTAAIAAGLRRLGVGKGDRVAAYMPNIPETLIAFLAAAGIGAVWSSCSPDLGFRSVVDRFQQIEPKVLFAVDGYQYNGRSFRRLDQVVEIQRNLPSLLKTVVVPYLDDRPDTNSLSSWMRWDELMQDLPERSTGRSPLTFTPVPFDHPLWIVYSSGTTGLPKPIVHGHGGIVLEHLKLHSLHMDQTESDRFFWYTSTTWIMWNLLVGALLVGSTVVMYDGSPGYPDLGALWRLAEETGTTYFGISAPYIIALMKSGLKPGGEFDLSSIRSIGSTGAPLPSEGFKWVYEHVKDGIPLGSISGGTDVATGFVVSCPILPVHAGEIQCRALGVKAEAFDEDGNSVTNQVGELVITKPMPSMPTHFWNDSGGRRYAESYFEMYPGIWRHGDWIRITPRGTCIIYGRSDSTLKRGGVRMGTSEFYQVVESIPHIVDSLVVDTSGLGTEGELILFVTLEDDFRLHHGLIAEIKTRLRQELSPRHIPDRIHQVPSIPRTLNGKKLEVPIRKILQGIPLEQALSMDALLNPDSVSAFVKLAKP